MKYLPWILGALLIMGLAAVLLTNPLQPRVGTIDIGRVIDESPRARELNQQLTDRYNELIDDIQADEEHSEGLAEEEQAEREREAYSEYLRFRQELEEQFEREVQNAVRDVAQAKRLTVVIDEDVVRFGGVDISDEIIQRLR